MDSSEQTRPLVEAQLKMMRGEGSLVRKNYLVEQTIGGILRSGVSIYLRHFIILFLVYALPNIPVQILVDNAVRSKQTTPLFLWIIVYSAVGLFAYAAMVIAVSDICTGNQPRFVRSYRRTLGRMPIRLLTTSILQSLTIVVLVLLMFVPLLLSQWLNGLTIGGLMVLLAIPVMVVPFWLILVPPVVVLEQKSNISAFKRSKQLGDGSHGRNAGIVVLLFIVLSVVGGILGAIFGLVLFAFGSAAEKRDLALGILGATIQSGLTMPIITISLVLIYYDRRVRKEGYDVNALSEDLAR